MTSADEQTRAAHRKAFFNRCAPQWMYMCYRGTDGAIAPAQDAAIRSLLACIPLAKSDVVLDVGCGSGVLVPYLLERLGTAGGVVELDCAEAMIAENRRLHDDTRLRFVAADLMAAPLPMQPFDVVLCFSCFPHFDDKPAALAVLHSLLRPGGHLAIAHTLSCAELNDHHWQKDAAVRHDHMLPPAELGSLLCDAGFTVHTAEDRPGWYLALAERSASATSPLR